jgi:hypothetical protein
MLSILCRPQQSREIEPELGSTFPSRGIVRPMRSAGSLDIQDIVDTSSPHFLKRSLFGRISADILILILDRAVSLDTAELTRVRRMNHHYSLNYGSEQCEGWVLPQYVHEEHASRANETYSRCVLVNRHWNAVLTDQLYRRPILRSPARLRLLARTLRIRTALASCVNEIVLADFTGATTEQSFYGVVYCGTAAERADVRAAFADVLELSTLRVVRFEGTDLLGHLQAAASGGSLLAPETVDALSTVRVLVLSGHASHLVWSPATWAAGAVPLPALEALTLDAVHLAGARWPALPALASLTLTRRNLTRALPADTVLLPGPAEAPALRELALQRVCGAQDRGVAHALATTVLAHARTLAALSVDAPVLAVLLENAAGGLAARFPVLRTLVFGAARVPARLAEEGGLPPGLRRLRAQSERTDVELLLAPACAASSLAWPELDARAAARCAHGTNARVRVAGPADFFGPALVAEMEEKAAWCERRGIGFRIDFGLPGKLERARRGARRLTCSCQISRTQMERCSHCARLFCVGMSPLLSLRGFPSLPGRDAWVGSASLVLSAENKGDTQLVIWHVKLCGRAAGAAVTASTDVCSSSAVRRSRR